MRKRRKGRKRRLRATSSRRSMSMSYVMARAAARRTTRVTRSTWWKMATKTTTSTISRTRTRTTTKQQVEDDDEEHNVETAAEGEEEVEEEESNTRRTVDSEEDRLTMMFSSPCPQGPCRSRFNRLGRTAPRARRTRSCGRCMSLRTTSTAPSPGFRPPSAATLAPPPPPHWRRRPLCSPLGQYAAGPARARRELGSRWNSVLPSPRLPLQWFNGPDLALPWYPRQFERRAPPPRLL